MLVENTENNRKVQKVISSMAIENMFFEQDFIRKMTLVADGKMTSEALRQEVIDEYVR